MNIGVIKALAKMPSILYRLESRRENESFEPFPFAIPLEQVDLIAFCFREEGGILDNDDEACIVAAYYEAACGEISGKLSSAEARRALREILEPAGFSSSCFARQRFILDNVTLLACGYANYESFKNSLAFPAQRLVRCGYRNNPRDWEGRWSKAYASLSPEEQRKAHATEMVATTDCAIWRKLSRWGDPYPPFDYCSGMDVLPVDIEEALALGLVADDNSYQLSEDDMPEINVEINMS